MPPESREHIIDKIVEGQAGVVLSDGLSVRSAVREGSDKQTVEQLINNLIGKIGENIRVRRFVRFKTGEGLEKRSTDLAADVRKSLGE